MKDLDSTTFQMALKSELEALTESTRKQNLDNMTLLKGMTKTMQALKDNDRFFKENDINLKEVLAHMVDYFNQINKLLNFKNDHGDHLDEISITGKKAVSATFLTALSKKESKSKLSNNNKVDSAVEKETSMIKNANNVMKRLQMSLFRNIQDT